MKKVITFGEIMLRLGAPDYLRLTQCNHLDMSFAGAEANVAVSLANYGIPVDYITRLPENPIADKCIRELLSYRVGTDKILRGGKRIGVLYLETGSNARPSRVFYDREDSAIAPFLSIVSIGRKYLLTLHGFIGQVSHPLFQKMPLVHVWKRLKSLTK